MKSHMEKYEQVFVNSGELTDSGVSVSAEVFIQYVKGSDVTIDKDKIKDLLTDFLYDVLATMDG